MDRAASPPNSPVDGQLDSSARSRYVLQGNLFSMNCANRKHEKLHQSEAHQSRILVDTLDFENKGSIIPRGDRTLPELVSNDESNDPNFLV